MKLGKVVEAPIQRIHNKLYYVTNTNLNFDKRREVTFPVLIEETLDAYFTLPSASGEIVDVAISHSVSAIELRFPEKTLSLRASFTSPETMMNLEFKNVPSEKCSACGQVMRSAK